MKYFAYKYLFAVIFVSFFYPSYGQIVNFNYDRDAKAVKNIITNNKNLLTPSKIENYTFDIDCMLKNRLLGTCLSSNIFFARDKNAIVHIKVQKEHNKIVGVCIYVTAREKNYLTGCIFFLAVKPEFHDKGYGKKLLSTAVQDLKKLNVIFIDAIIPLDNYAVQQLYQSCGFSFRDKGPEGDHYRYIR